MTFPPSRRCVVCRRPEGTMFYRYQRIKGWFHPKCYDLRKAQQESEK